AHDGGHELDDVDRPASALEHGSQREPEAEPADEDASIRGERGRAPAELVLGVVVARAHELDTAHADRELVAALGQDHLAARHGDALEDDRGEQAARVTQRGGERPPNPRGSRSSDRPADRAAALPLLWTAEAIAISASMAAHRTVSADPRADAPFGLKVGFSEKRG